ncbi:heparinase II/III domain-containing protein [Edaphobacter albus]|uniref:heparinase II/III domain-containing protein n=1 Tax=Edaphobacter sp. 4G125 TaxID=2763071 RepID=UPI001644DD3C|nr:heparinase II/III family protein [Edaphobacter sp. 4G125]QNI36871.1 heparinase II/III family protein [Edaphobacter sp. 4G125]
MNRRDLLRGSAALWGAGYFSPLSGWSEVVQDVDQLAGPPKHLLISTFTAELLRTKLVLPGQWHPYPRATERDAWMQMPEDLRAAMVKRAEMWHGKDWPSLLATTALDYKRNGNRSRYEDQQFGRRHRLIDLVLGECAEGKGRFLDDITNGAWLICEESFWGAPAHLGAQRAGIGLPDVAEPIVDLFAAETASTMALVEYLLAERLNSVSPRIVPRIRLEAKRRVLDPLLMRDDFGWMGLKPKRGHLNNWNPWINSNWLMTNLLLEEDAERRQQAIERSCRSLDEFLSDYSPDGGCEEGPVYWQRSPGSYFDCCRTLASATGGAADVMTHPFVRKMGQYIADVHIAGHAYVNYGDAHMEDAPTPELVYRYGMAAKLPTLSEFGAFYSAKDSLGAAGNSTVLERALGAGLPSLARILPDVLCASEIRTSQKVDALGRDSWYPALHLMTAREKAGTTDGFYLAVQAASNGRSHGHNDSGSFILFHDGEPVFIDVGVEAYTAKTFSPERYTIWTMQSAFHNLPTINGVMQHEGNPYAASEVKYTTSDDGAGMTANLAIAYPPEAGVERWMREIRLDRKAGIVRLAEDFELTKSGSVALSFMTSRIPSESGSGAFVLHSEKAGVKDVSLRYDAAALAFNMEKMELQDAGMRRSWGPAVYRVQLRTKADVTRANWKFEIA